MKYTVGQKVVFLFEQGGGVIKSISNSFNYVIEDEHGFEREFKASEIGPVYGEEYNIEEDEINGLNEDESYSVAKLHIREGQLTGSRKPIDVWEIDLHIEELIDSHSGWSNMEIIRKQLMELRSFYNRARAQRIRKLVVIHGVGQGVLKSEVQEFFRGQEGVETYDADYLEYGKGATVVELRYNL